MHHDEIKRYLIEVLGVTPIINPWDGEKSLPYYLQDAFEFASIELLGGRYVLIIDRDHGDGASKIRKHIDTLLTATGAVGIYVAPVTTSYERKRLVEQRVPFIVPGNQLYLPDLGIDLREYFRLRKSKTTKNLSPATQALLITALLDPSNEPRRPAALGERLGYTSMTLSRAVQELEQNQLANVVEFGRERWVHFDEAHAVWHKARSLMSSPVKKEFWAIPTQYILQRARLAGESALASKTMLADPLHPIYAVSTDEWRLAELQGLKILPHPEPGAYQWQIWRYSPELQPNAPTVDPFSLVISLKNNRDDRVQVALSEFEDQLPW